MAGVTNVAFRTLCRELEQERVGTVSGLYVCEMVTARALVERHPVTMHMTTFSADESPRSLQLYTVDPATTYAAVKMIADEGLADHVDMNFGCPVPKVTRRGGGAALPYKRQLFGQIVSAAVRGTEGTDIPVTVKYRIGIDDEHHTHLEAGKIAESEGAAAVALHARTAAQRYSGTADWEQIALLKQHVQTIPVLGNGDIFEANDALTMMASHRLRRRRHRSRLPGPAVAVRRTLRGVHRQPGTDAAQSGRGRRPSSAGTASCSASTSAKTKACVTCANTSPGTCTASRPARTCGARSPWSRPSTSWTGCWTTSTAIRRSRPPRTGPAAVKDRRRGWRCPRAGWRTATTARFPSGADVMHSGG